MASYHMWRLYPARITTRLNVFPTTYSLSHILSPRMFKIRVLANPVVQYWFQKWFWLVCNTLMGVLDGTDCSDQLFVGAPVNALWLIRAVMLDYSKQFNNTAQPDSTVGGILDNFSTLSHLPANLTTLCP